MTRRIPGAQLVYDNRIPIVSFSKQFEDKEPLLALFENGEMQFVAPFEATQNLFEHYVAEMHRPEFRTLLQRLKVDDESLVIVVFISVYENLHQDDIDVDYGVSSFVRNNLPAETTTEPLPNYGFLSPGGDA